MSEVKMNIAAISDALESGLNTTIHEIYVPSLKKKVAFKPLTTGQCKTMAKILIESDGKPFDTFRAVVAMINATCAEKMDINELSELDRIKIMLEFYINNNILKDFDIKCPECGTTNKIKIDISEIINKLEKINVEPIEFENGQTDRLTCLVEIPKLPVMHMFYEAVQNGTVELEDISTIFIKKLCVEFSKKDVNPIEFSLEEFDSIIDYIESVKMIPYILTVNTDTDKSVFDNIMEMLDEVMSNGSINQKCKKCGCDFSEVASAQNFI